jgi:PKD repeat protein
VFLDVVSESRNKKGKPDVTPISISKDIEVKPRLWNIILLINGVNVSNLDTLKVNPNLGKIWLLFDASASRAVSNGTIIKTKWDFGNGNTLEYDGAPVLERQLYVNPEMYRASVEITTNQWQTFRKQIQLLVRDPAAVISLDKETGFIDEDIPMSAKTYLANTTNVEYGWEIQDVESWKKTIASKKWSAFSHKFKNVWQYLITLTTRSPNGNIDTDSRMIIIESRPPVINLDTPRAINTEKPNTILFDASRSYDPDKNNAKWLSYKWIIDWEQVDLNDSLKEWAIWSYTFSEKWNHTVTLTVTNEFGKVTTVEKNFEVLSTLTVWVNITPRAAPIGTLISFQARSPQARFYEWNLGDGSPTINGTADFIQNTYKKTGVYAATLTVKNSDGSEENRITRKIYITDTDRPFALIDIKSSNGSAIEDPAACDNPDWAFVINRAESTTIDGGNSINTDGNSAWLSYTWKYMDRVKTGPSISEKFTELGCFPVELTVRSDRTWASHTSTRYIQIKNIIPKVTSVTASVDTTKKDTQKIIANVVANGARDDDWVIRSYIWFYTTESDSEKQNVRITQSPTTSFVLPNVTEKYYFGVIVEDNDGARYDSSEIANDQVPLLIANDDANINMPLISLNVVNLNKDRWFFLADETVQFSASAKNIIGNEITDKSEYYWDFDGDSRIDQKTTEPQASYTYKKSGKYNMKVKVLYNGVSNTKYQLIYVKNELKANAVGYRIWDMTYFMNASRGTYDSAKWNIGSIESSSLYWTSVPNAVFSSSWESIGNLTIKSWANEISTIELTESMIQTIERSATSINIQSYPALESDTITIKSPWDKVLISLYGNTWDEYIIDQDVKIDSDLDAVNDNDKDNKDTSSYTDWSTYSIPNLSDVKTRSREMKVTVLEKGRVVWSKNIKLIFDYIKSTEWENTKEITGTWSESFSTNDKENLEKLQAKIRTFSPEDRIIFTQYYNSLIENWDNINDRTEGLLLIQKEVLDNTNFDEPTKTELSDIIDVILVWDAQATNEISVAGHVIEWLVPIANPNRPYIIERLEQIKAHPGSLAENKILGKEILQKIQEDTTITTENKLLIKSQLLTIVNWWQENVPESEVTKMVQESEQNSSILGFIGWTVKIFLLVIGVIIGLFLIGYIVYRISRKNGDMWFQDFLIDSVAHTKSPAKTDAWSNIPKQEVRSTVVVPENPLPSNSDPLATIGVYHQSESSQKTAPEPTITHISSDSSTNPVIQESHTIPDWLKPVQKESPQIKESSTNNDSPKRIQDDSDSIIIKSSSPEVISSEKNDIWIASGSHTENHWDDNDSIIISDTPRTDIIEDTKIDWDTSTETSVIKIEESSVLSPDDPFALREEPTDIMPLVEDTPVKATSDDSIIITAAKEEEELIPDWLKPLSSSPEEPPVETQDTDSISPEDTQVVEVQNPDAELPDWLKESMDTDNKEEVIPEDTDTKEKKKKPKILQEKKKKVSENEPKKSPWTSSHAWVDDIPDWLK